MERRYCGCFGECDCVPCAYCDEGKHSPYDSCCDACLNEQNRQLRIEWLISSLRALIKKTEELDGGNWNCWRYDVELNRLENLLILSKEGKLSQ